MLRISFPDGPDIIVNIELENALYQLRFLYNTDDDAWTLSLRDKDNQPLIEGIKIVPNFPLLWLHHLPGVPGGEFMALSQADNIGRDAFTKGAATFIYMTEEEYYP